MPNLPSQAAEELDPARRIALAYAPAKARPAWLAMFMLEQKLSQTARPGREPLMIQLRLSWWRDRLGESGETWPVSEPVLAALKAWRGQHGRLVALVDGWEAHALADTDEDQDGRQLAAARVEAYVALAEVLGLRDLRTVRGVAEKLTGISPDATGRVARPMRPLAVLAAMERGAEASPVANFFGIARAGLLGF